MDIVTAAGDAVVENLPITEDLFLIMSMSLIAMLGACAKLLQETKRLTFLGFISEMFSSVFCGVLTLAALLGQPWVELNYYAMGAITGYVSYKGAAFLDDIAAIILGKFGIRVRNGRLEDDSTRNKDDFSKHGE